MIPLYDHQRKALKEMKNGCILCGDVGSGKSRTALAYFYFMCGGDIDTKSGGRMVHPKDLYVITTARKRDTLDWEGEMVPFAIGSKELYPNASVTVDSWNNIKKYTEVKDAFFIFDEDRVTGSGVWVKSFLRITRNNNRWIILSATPGDTWMDYIPVFIANGFYKNKTEFIRRHVVYKRFVKFPMVEKYLDEGRLIRLRRKILVPMDFNRETIQHHETIWCDYDKRMYKDMCKTRWNIYTEEPMQNAAEFCYCLRRLVNSSSDRQLKLLELLEDHPRAIIFYNFDYELELLKEICNGLRVYEGEVREIAEWNGHLHQPVPESSGWTYLVQYTAGCEGWNCIATDTIIFFSQNYSYKVMHQSAGRIDRLNTPFVDLHYYWLRSRSGIDLAIKRAIEKKKTFNERGFEG